ncbi:MAG: AAA family ATPase, partial [Paludibacteraceae bacterium]|nr:AAA family ATPase [Paludibacteraceae bacterium]
AIRTKQIRKTSKYADEIMYAQDALIRMVNGSLNGTMSGADVINLTRYDDLVKVAHAEVVSEIAKIAAQFIKIQEKEGKEKEAETLLKRIEKSNEKGEEIDGMKKALKNYVEGKTTKLKASEQVLKGLHGIVDVNFESGDVVNSTTIEGKHFDTLDFHGRWEGFFGKPSPDFKFMFYGKPGNGKSTLALQFAGYLSKELGKSVLYVANEEGFGYTLQEKVKRLNVANSNLYLCDSVPEDLSQFDVVFLDSVNNLGLKPKDLKEMPSDKAYVYIFQSRKDGNYMGEQEYSHNVDAVVRVENFNAYKDKNRYGGAIQEFKVG